MYDDLCYAVCQHVRQRSVRQLPWPSCCYAFQMANRRRDHPTLRNQLFLGRADQFNVHCHSILTEVFRNALVFNDLAGWNAPAQRDFLIDVFRQFFRQNECHPGLIWATPTWFLMGSGLPDVVVENRLDQLGVVAEPTDRTPRSPVTLLFGPGRPTLEIPASPEIFFYPQERDSRPSLLRLVRARTERHANLQSAAVYEECFSLACPGMKEDDRWLTDAKVPVHSHEGFFNRIGSVAFLDSCVLTLGVMVPYNDHRQAEVDYLTIFFHRDNARPLEFSTSSRSFDSFLLFHPGMVDALIWKILEG